MLPELLPGAKSAARRGKYAVAVTEGDGVAVRVEARRRALARHADVGIGEGQ